MIYLFFYLYFKGIVNIGPTSIANLNQISTRHTHQLFKVYNFVKKTIDFNLILLICCS